MELLSDSGIPVLPLDQALARPGSVAITFDDGFCNFAEHAVPLMERYRFPATIFAVSGYCGGENNWPSQPRAGIRRSRLMSWQTLRDLPAGISVGAHTVTHPPLTALSVEECDRELRQCRDDIQQQLGRPVPWLAYPYGSSSPRIRSLAARYFELAAGTSLRFVSADSDRMDLPRLDTYYLQGSVSPDRIFTRSGSLYLAFRKTLRALRQSIPRGAPGL
jgi:peptidoglycan/xylan/chitin deacetylase (PgdA/CDA1 family)